MKSPQNQAARVTEIDKRKLLKPDRETDKPNWKSSVRSFVEPSLKNSKPLKPTLEFKWQSENADDGDKPNAELNTRDRVSGKFWSDIATSPSTNVIHEGIR